MANLQGQTARLAMVLQSMINSYDTDQVTTVIPEDTVNRAIAFMRYMLKCKLILMSDPSERAESGGSSSVSQPAHSFSEQLSTADPDIFYELFRAHIPKTLKKCGSRVLASALSASHTIPPIVDEEGNKYNVKLATAWIYSLERLGLGEVTVSSRGAASFCSKNYNELADSSRVHLMKIGVGEDYGILKKPRTD